MNKVLLILLSYNVSLFAFASAEPTVPAPPARAAGRSVAEEVPYYHQRVTPQAHVALNVDRMREWAIRNKYEIHFYINNQGNEVYVAGSSYFFKSGAYNNVAESGVYSDKGRDVKKSNELAKIAFSKEK